MQNSKRLCSSLAAVCGDVSGLQSLSLQGCCVEFDAAFYAFLLTSP